MTRHLILLALLVSFFSALIEPGGPALISNESTSISAAAPCVDHSTSTPVSHNTSHCAYSHCHFGHCGINSNTSLDLGLELLSYGGFAYKNLTPYSYLKEILRPPIA